MVLHSITERGYCTVAERIEVTAQYCSREYRSYCTVAESAEFAACYREDKGYCTEEECTYKGYCTVAEST